MRRGLLFLCLIFMPVFLLAQESDISKPGDILITEIMANPVGLTELPETEYVEIYNTTGAEISLSGWFFVYESSEIALPDAVLQIGRAHV